MPAFVVVCYRRVNNPALLAEYSRKSIPTLKAWEGRVRVANVAGVALEGVGAANVVILEFADVATARSWYESPEYQEAAVIRREAADVDIMIVDGIPTR